MIVYLQLKQSGRSVGKTIPQLLEALKTANPAHTGDIHQIKAALYELEFDVEGHLATVTPEITEIVKKDQYYALQKMLDRLHPKRVRQEWVVRGYLKHVSVPSNLAPLHKELSLLLDELMKANGNVHHELKFTEADQLVAQKIHLAQTNILIFIGQLCEGQNGEESLLNALLDCGFVAYLQDYLVTQGCNMEAAAQLNKRLRRIECSQVVQKNNNERELV